MEGSEIVGICSGGGGEGEDEEEKEEQEERRGHGEELPEKKQSKLMRNQNTEQMKKQADE